MTGTTNLHADPAASYEAALAELRVTGAVLLHECYAPPWAVEVPDEAALRRLTGAGPEARVMPFHLIRRGGLRLCHPALPDAELRAQEVAMCASGAAHVLAAGSGARPVPLAGLLAGEGAMPLPGGAADTELVCGVFRIRAAPLNPLLAALPPVLRIETSAAGPHPVLARAAEALLLNLSPEGGDAFTSARLLELFCGAAIRAWLSERAAVPGWQNGAQDPRIGRALAAIHADPAAPWTVARLAADAAMSPSRFAARFRALVGQSVMAYVTAWRMNAACRMLADTDAPMARVAEAAGYEDAASFGRAFKAAMGASPAAWRETGREAAREAGREAGRRTSD